MQIPGVNLNKQVDGKWSLQDAWHYYTVNVKLLGTISHEQFCQENPEAATEIENAAHIQEKLSKLLEE